MFYIASGLLEKGDWGHTAASMLDFHLQWILAHSAVAGNEQPIDW